MRIFTHRCRRTARQTEYAGRRHPGVRTSRTRDPLFRFGAAARATAVIGLAWAGLWPLPSSAEARRLDDNDLAAIRTYVAAARSLYEMRETRVTPMEREALGNTDRNRSGLVGVEESRLVTTPGYLAAKHTSTHPLWVAVIRTWLRDFGLQPGDCVAIGASGSFPAFLLAARIAAESLELKPVVIASLTSSHYGATVESFDLWDMEHTLLEGGFLTTPLHGLTPGGNRDRAHRATPEVATHVLQRIEHIRSTTPSTEVFVPATARESYEWRIRVFFEENNTQAFINVGGHTVNFGSGARLLELPAGPIPPGTWDAPAGRSVLLHALRRHIPAIHLLNVRGLAGAYAIPFDSDGPDFFALNSDLSRRTVESWWAGENEISAEAGADAVEEHTQQIQP